MPHVREGTLHAWLDGALSADAPEAARELERHIEACEDCRARLADAQRLRHEAGAILEMADPGEIEPPAFAEIRERAGTDEDDDGGIVPVGRSTGLRHRRVRRARVPLAWAASIALAVTAGWWARQATAPTTDERVAMRDEPVERLATDAPAGAGAADAPDRPEGTDGAEAADVGEATDAPAATATDGAADPPIVAQAEEQPTGDEERGEPSPGDEPDLVASATGDAPADRERDAEPTAAFPSEAPPAAGIMPRRTRAVAETAPMLADDAAGPIWRPATGEEAEAWIGGTLHRVPDLPVIDHALAGTSAAPVVRIRQRLPEGETLVLLHRLAVGSADDDPGDTVTSVRRGDIVVSGHAPLAPDSLRALLLAIRP